MPELIPLQSSLGWWKTTGRAPASEPHALRDALLHLGEPFWLLRSEAGYAVGHDGVATLSMNGHTEHAAGDWTVAAYVPACPPEALGSASFCSDYGLRYPYVTGAMANGIGSVEIVEAMSRTGMLGFFGSAGLGLARIEAAIDRLQRDLGEAPYGFNLIHAPHEPRMEAETVSLYLRRGVRLVDASAYLDLTLPLVRYATHGIHTDATGSIVAPNTVIAKVSRIEVARRFFSPPSAKLLAQLVQSGDLTEAQARMAETIPVARDLTAEADSGGHTDNQPFVTLIPTLRALRDELQAHYRYARPLRVGAAGGISTPASAAAAFLMGAAYVMTGSVNQSCVEAGTSPIVREMLCASRQADVTMAPAADMFELGVKVQVLKRGTMFAMRAAKLHELYRAHASLEGIPAPTRETLERDYFRAPLEQIWEQTKSFFADRDPAQVAKADKDPHHKMALVFRWYLGLSSHWANTGEPTRKMDYQVWCGPAMGAFNEWVRGTFLEHPADRNVVAVALNILHGAGALTRLHYLRMHGIQLPEELSAIRPLPLDELQALLGHDEAPAVRRESK